MIERVEIANMHEQTMQREERLLEAVADAPPSTSAVVAVVAGDGNRRLFESLGATKIVEGGQTMNPSTADLVKRDRIAPAAESHPLPNNSQRHPRRRTGGELCRTSRCAVLPTDSMQAGLAAMLAFDPDATREENAAAMHEARSTRS